MTRPSGAPPALPTRRSVLGWAAAAGAAGCASLSAEARPAATADDTLGALAARKGLLLGASFATHELDAPYGSSYAALYRREVRALTSELELKMGSIRPDADTVDLAAADRLFAFAAETGHKVRGHTLVWNDALPDWIKVLSPSDAGRLMDTHIETVLGRYSGRAFAWDVVNEPIAPWDNLPGNLRAGPFLRAYGEAYIARSFAAARRFDPSAKLVLNEAFTETDDARGETFRQSFKALLMRLKDTGAPIDAVGLQCHLKSSAAYDFPRFAAFVAEIAAMGYEIHVTELDVDDSALPGSVAARDARVADLYRRFLAAVLPIPAVTVLTFWQLADHTSWLHYRAVETRPGARRRPRPLPFDAAFQRKPAWHAVADALRVMPPR